MTPDGPPILHAAERNNVPAHVILSKASSGLAYRAQCELVLYFQRLDFTPQQIGIVFGRSLSWVQRRIADGLEDEVVAEIKQQALEAA